MTQNKTTWITKIFSEISAIVEIIEFIFSFIQTIDNMVICIAMKNAASRIKKFFKDFNIYWKIFKNILFFDD